MKERALLEAAELDRFNLGVFVELIEVAENWKCDGGSTVTACPGFAFAPQ